MDPNRINAHHMDLSLSSLAQELPALGINADVVTFNALITAHANAQPQAQWERSLHLLRSLTSHGIAPDIISYNAALAALGKGGQWQQAVALLDELRQAEAQRRQQAEFQEKGGDAGKVAEVLAADWAAKENEQEGLVDHVAAEMLTKQFFEEGSADNLDPPPRPNFSTRIFCVPPKKTKEGRRQQGCRRRTL